MIERRFVGWKRPLLPEAAVYIGGFCKASDVIIALPGAQARRRLLWLIEEVPKSDKHSDFKAPAIMTPAALMEHLYFSDCKCADAIQSYFAWIQAVPTLSDDEVKLLAPKAEGKDSPMAWAGIAREAQRARAAATAECKTLGKIAADCAKLPELCDDKRWQALAKLEKKYLENLMNAGLCDRDEARMAALYEKRVSCDKTVFLVGTQDLNGLERAMLKALDSVTAIIPAPEEEAAKIDETGSLLVDSWYESPIPIPKEALQFVDGPAEETEAILSKIRGLGGGFSAQEITIGVGDEAAAETLARRLAVLGVPSYSPFGRLLSRTRPAALLSAVRDYLHSPTVDSFAALIRHPDIESWLTARLTQSGADSVAEEEDAGGTEREQALPLLTSLDIYRAECLPHVLPTGDAAEALCKTSCPTRAKSARKAVLAAHDAAAQLFVSLRDAKQTMSQWAAPIITILQTVYAETWISGNPGDRQFKAGLKGLQEILQRLKDLPSALSPLVSGAEALAYILEQAEAVRLPSELSVDEGKAGVEMMGWLELALDDAPVLLLTGLFEGCVPASIGDDPLLPDNLRQKLGLADDRRRAARDGFLLRQMIENRQSEGRHVALIVPRRGADGDPRMPSRLLFSCDAHEAAVRALQFADPPQAAAAQPMFAPGKQRQLTPPQPIKPDIPLTEMSVSAFADYLACPYRFYLRHILKLEEQDDSQDEMDPRLFGVLVHSCLSAFARSSHAQSADASAIKAYFQAEIPAQIKNRFGDNPSRLITMQARQAERRLEAFAGWQAQSAAEGWVIQPQYSEKELKADIDVDGELFTVKGRVDRVDYHAAADRYRIIDYKTGDTAKRPEDKHCPKGVAEQWTELQLPLYRLLLSAMEVDMAKIFPDELGYALLSADLARANLNHNGTLKGGIGFVSSRWGQDGMGFAEACIKEVIRKIRKNVFWPPTDPPPFPPSRMDPGRVDVYNGLCLDSCSDRSEWFRKKQGENSIESIN